MFTIMNKTKMREVLSEILSTAKWWVRRDSPQKLTRSKEKRFEKEVLEKKLRYGACVGWW
jgi:hypothetical protein